MDWSGLRPEVSEIKNMQPEITEFQEIKPQEGMTFQEAQDFWKDMFSSEIKPDEIHTSEKGISDSDVGAGKQEVDRKSVV